MPRFSSACRRWRCSAHARFAPTNHLPTPEKPPCPRPPRQVPSDHAALLASSDPKLAANKRLVYDMYRIVLQGGYADRAGEFIAEDYIQHNPNAEQGLAGVQDYIRKTRGEIPLEERVELPMINIMAEGDFVTIAFVRTEKDSAGATYYTTWLTCSASRMARSPSIGTRC